MNEENIFFEEEKVRAPKQTLLHILVFVIMFVSVINTVLLVYLSVKPVPAATQTVESSLKLQKEIAEYRENVFEECVKYSDFEVVETDYSTHIKGTIKNRSDKDLANVQIMFKCYDSFGDYIGMSSAYVEYLPAKSTQVTDSYTHDDADNIKVFKVQAIYADEIM